MTVQIYIKVIGKNDKIVELSSQKMQEYRKLFFKD